MKKLLVGSVFVLMGMMLLSILGLEGTALATEKVYTWKCATYIPMSSSSYKDSLLTVAERIKKRSNSRLIIEIYPSGALIPGKEVFNAVKRGMVPIGVISSGYNTAQIPLLNVSAGLPLNFGSIWEAVYFHHWLGFEKMLKDEFIKQGMLSFTDKLFPTELALKKPVRKMEDFKGLKLRSYGILQKFLTSIGAAASYIPGGEAYAALASGMMEGASWGAVQGNSSMKFYEVCKYHLRPAVSVAEDMWVVNKKAFDKLPKDLQGILTKTLEEEFWMRTNQYIYQENRALSDVQKNQGVELIVLPPAEFAKMQVEAMKIWEEVAKKSPECEKAVKMLIGFHKEMGRIK